MFWTVLLGTVTGMRTMTAIAVICWAARAGWLPLEGTWAFWAAKTVSAVVFTVLALGEYVGDTLPTAPSRKTTGPLLARIFFGVLAGVLVATALGQPKVGGVLFGGVGALIGTYGGYRVRMKVAAWIGRDLPAALMESASAVMLAVLSVVHIHREIVKFMERAML